MAALRDDLCRRGYELRETHISWVFLGEDRVYKVKKPVSLGFLDFSSLDGRHAACEAEVALNRRLAPDVYLGVVPIVRGSDGEHHIDDSAAGGGEIVDWAVMMTRLQDADSAEQRLKAGTLAAADVEAIAERLARFHAGARCDDATTRFGSVASIRHNVVENFEQTRETGARYLDAAALEEVQRWQLAFLDEHGELLEQRMAEGRVRDGHGDLRLEHVYLDDDADERIRVIDCIEFNHRFRYADVAADLAFLSMDLRGHDAPELAELLLAAYARESDDFELYALVDFYESYRAYVRGKVSAMLAEDAEAPHAARERAQAHARRYFLLAQASERAALSPPQLIAVCGMVASGKSTIAEALRRQRGLPIVDADRTRKALAGAAPAESLADGAFQGAYAPEQTARVYAELFQRARRVLASGRSVIVDASFRAREHRRAARALATELGVDFRLLECVAPRERLEARLRAREDGESVSDARADLLASFEAAWEPIDELPDGEHLRLETTGDAEDNASRAVELLQL